MVEPEEESGYVPGDFHLGHADVNLYERRVSDKERLQGRAEDKARDARRAPLGFAPAQQDC